MKKCKKEICDKIKPIMQNILCALCGTKQKISILYPATFDKKDVSIQTYSARREPDKIHYRILRCQRCGLFFSSPIFSPARIKKLYRESLCTYNHQIPYLSKTYLRLFKKIQHLLPPNPKILEVGCGNGFFLETLRQNDMKDVFGIEPSRGMVLQAPISLRKRIKIDIFKRNQFRKNFFDVVCCFHTLDHMVDPNEFVSETFSVLKKGGFVLIVVHDTEGLSVKLLGEKSPIFDIEHIFLFNKKNLRKILDQHHFFSIKTFNIANTYPLSYWVHLFPFSKMLKTFLLHILTFVKIDTFPITMFAGNIGVSARK